MKKKLLFAVIAILGLFLAASRAQAPASPVAKFQLFAAECETGDGRVPTVFRINTQTGEVFTYRDGRMPPSETPDKVVESWRYWKKVDEQWIFHDGLQEAAEAVKRSQH